MASSTAVASKDKPEVSTPDLMEVDTLSPLDEKTKSFAIKKFQEFFSYRTLRELENSLSITLFPKSNECDVFKIEDNNESESKKSGINTYILRSLSNYDAAKELAITTSAGESGIGALVYGVDSTKKYTLLEYLNGGVLDTKKQDFLSDVAALFKRLHSLPLPVSLRDKLPSTQVKRFNQVFKQIKTKIKPPQFLLDLHGRVNQIDEIFRSHAKMYRIAICHHDTHSENFMWHNQKLKLIDWEHAYPDDPLIDAARVALMLNLTPDQEVAFVQEYSGKNLNSKTRENSAFNEHYQLARPLACLECLNHRLQDAVLRGVSSEYLSALWKKNKIPDFWAEYEEFFSGKETSEITNEFPAKKFLSVVNEFNRRCRQ